MALLPPADGHFVISQNGGVVTLENAWTGEAIVEFDPGDADATAKAQKTIHESELNDEQKAFAHFWSGYFFAYARGA